MSTVPSNEYQQRVAAESRKWGEHLQVEASGDWNSWLDHPLISAHYRSRGLIDGLSWERWVPTRLGRPAERSLDLGCGSGGKSVAVFEAGASRFVEGVDVSEDRIAEGERTRENFKIPGKFRVADINSVAIPESTYDLIFSAHSFHHFLELERIMENVSRGLTPDGLFILEEFVGPTQFQWTDYQIDLVRSLLSLVPTDLKMLRWNVVKPMEGRPTVAEVVAASPFESIRSSEITPLFKRYFDLVEVRFLGGTLQHLLYNGIVHNFTASRIGSADYIKAIYEVEDALIDGQMLPSDFMLLIGTRRK